jgi:hypothetical protein
VSAISITLDESERLWQWEAPALLFSLNFSLGLTRFSLQRENGRNPFPNGRMLITGMRPVSL